MLQVCAARIALKLHNVAGRAARLTVLDDEPLEFRAASLWVKLLTCEVNAQRFFCLVVRQLERDVVMRVFPNYCVKTMSGVIHMTNCRLK